MRLLSFLIHKHKKSVSIRDRGLVKIGVDISECEDTKNLCLIFSDYLVC